MAAPHCRTTQEILSDLSYISYSTNRALAPHVSPERWAKLYGFPEGTAVAFELRYQAELRKREPRCEGYEPLDATGETAIPCGARTVKCPVCNKESGFCEVHLLECSKCHKKMCSECSEAVDWPCRGCQEVQP
jgi:hypothetical protein